jgi:UDP-3-O-acyl-N-acetylglucosamine deacetylase
LNNKLLRKLLENQDAWEEVDYKTAEDLPINYMDAYTTAE